MVIPTIILSMARFLFNREKNFVFESVSLASKAVSSNYRDLLHHLNRTNSFESFELFSLCE